MPPTGVACSNYITFFNSYLRILLPFTDKCRFMIAEKIRKIEQHAPK
jgi:hypothetical protein